MKITVKRVLEMLQDCNPEAEFEIVMDGQIPAKNIFVSCGYRNHVEKNKNLIKMEPKNCDVVTFNIVIE